MSEIEKPIIITRRRFIATATALGAVGTTNAALADASMIDSIINAPKRGDWDEQFDAAASSSAASVRTNNPIFGPDAASNLQRAIFNYETTADNGGWPQVLATSDLRIGMIDAQVSTLRKRLMISGDLGASAGISDIYDSLVDEAVKRFQARHGLPLDGVLGKFTRDAMNVPANVRLTQLRTNLNRVSAINADLGQRYVVVNIPGAYIEAVENNRVISRHMAIVGRIDRATPVFDSKIHEVILNPYWTSPRSIVEKDIVPLMRKDPTYLAKNAIRLLDDKGNEVDPATIDWNGPAPNLTFRQDPGKINAMASTKINFPNAFATYMHDTPQQGLFNRLVRNDSSGCVRVQNIRDLTTWLLRDTAGWPRQQIEATIKTRKNTPIRLANPVAVHFKYVTAWSAKDGVVQFRDDIYRQDGLPEVALSTGLNQELSAAE